MFTLPDLEGAARVVRESFPPPTPQYNHAPVQTATPSPGSAPGTRGDDRDEFVQRDRKDCDVRETIMPRAAPLRISILDDDIFGQITAYVAGTPINVVNPGALGGAAPR